MRSSVTLKPAAESFAQGWKEAQSGMTKPVSELWEGIKEREYNLETNAIRNRKSDHEDRSDCQRSLHS